MSGKSAELVQKAESAKKKPSAIGPDIDMSSFSTRGKPLTPLSRMEELPQDDRERMLNVGVTPKISERSGTFVQIDDSVVYSGAREEGVQVMGTQEALREYPWLRDYYWKALPVDTDKYSAAVELSPGGGYFIRIEANHKALHPVQSCLYISTDSLSQRVHNIIIVEEGAELHVITGCANSVNVGRGLHLGVSEFYVKRGGKLSFTMIHNWGKDVAVRPRTGAIVEEGGTLVSNYICLEPSATIQTYPTAHLAGRGAVARFYSLLLATPGSEVDVGARVMLEAPESRAEILSRAVSTGGTIVARGDMVGTAPGVKGHLECDGLILSEKGRIHAVPELRGELADVDLSHEAAVGRVSQEEIDYLMARGLSEREATATIVRGFLDVRIEGLPEQLSTYVQRIVEQSEKKLSM